MLIADEHMNSFQLRLPTLNSTLLKPLHFLNQIVSATSRHAPLVSVFLISPYWNLSNHFLAASDSTLKQLTTCWVSNTLLYDFIL